MQPLQMARVTRSAYIVQALYALHAVRYLAPIPMASRPDPRRERLQASGGLHPHPDRITSELIGRSAFFSPDDLVQMKYEMLRSVEVDRHTVRDAARTFGLSRVAYYRALRQYEADGLHGLLPQKKGPRRSRKFTPEIRAFIETHLPPGRAPDWTAVGDLVEERFGVRLHPRSIERAVRRQKRGPHR